MKKYIASILLFCIYSAYSQEEIDLSEFQMANNTSPVFQLLEETPTDIYTPENVKALAFHVQNNFGESMAIEIAPYFFINTESMNRTYYKYIGVSKEGNDLKQNPFSGINTTSISFSYLKKDFEKLNDENEFKTFSIGARTTLLRFYNKEKVYNRAEDISDVLYNLSSPSSELLNMEEGPEKTAKLLDFYMNQQNIEERLEPFLKTIKPIFKLDGSLAYSNLLLEDSFEGDNINRFGAWLTGEFSLILNEDSKNSNTNNYVNFLFTTRYIEDGFIRTSDTFQTNYYRDLGAKISFDLGKFNLGYEYIKRKGSLESERSVGNLNYAINKNITITGGFGKDFKEEDSILTLFGLNWGVNLGDSGVAVNP